MQISKQRESTAQAQNTAKKIRARREACPEYDVSLSILRAHGDTIGCIFYRFGLISNPIQPEEIITYNRN